MEWEVAVVVHAEAEGRIVGVPQVAGRAGCIDGGGDPDDGACAGGVPCFARPLDHHCALRSWISALLRTYWAEARLAVPHSLRSVRSRPGRPRLSQHGCWLDRDENPPPNPRGSPRVAHGATRSRRPAGRTLSRIKCSRIGRKTPGVE